MNISLIPYLKPAVAGASGATFGTPFVLAADTPFIQISSGFPWANGVWGLVKEGFLPGQRRAIQPGEVFRGIYKGNIPRNQLENSLKFTVQRKTSTLDIALAFLQTHAGYVPSEGCLMVTLTGLGTTYLPNAVVVDIQTSRHIGAAFDTTYSLVGSYRPDRGTGGPWQLTQA